MSLAWVKLSTDIYTHEKVLGLLEDRDGAKAFVVYVSSLAYSGGHDTAGRIHPAVLPMLHGTPRLAALLVEHGFWQEQPGAGWQIHHFAERQASKARQRAGMKGNCLRWHGPTCGCWEVQ